MLRYRIEISTNDYGEVFYTPQVGEVYLKCKIFQNLTTIWENIIIDDGKFITSKYESDWYKTEKRALETIEQYKDYLSKLDKPKQKYMYIN